VNGSEQALIDRCLTGDESAFESLYAAHAGRVKAYLTRSGFDAPDADDLVQEVFVRVFRSLGTFDGQRGSFRAWLGAIARNVARKHWSRRPHWHLYSPELAEEVFAAADNPGAGPAAREEFRAVRACVEALPPEMANVIRLRYEDGRTTRGIAAATGMPESTVRSRLAEARAAVARCLKAKGFFD
jgi:RNA polymerase sigma-70 factor (ECF subfamily)